MKSTSTTYVILGVLQWRPRSGYEIKQLVDRSTRFFWAASYGQIYPELRRLEAAGLIAGRDDPDNPRGRRLWELTSAGRQELVAWLTADEEPLLETRDEGMLKFFFAAILERDEAEALLRRISRRHARLADRIDRLREEVYGDNRPEGDFPYASLEYGLTQQHTAARWYGEAARRLARRGRRRNAPDADGGGRSERAGS